MHGGRPNRRLGPCFAVGSWPSRGGAKSLAQRTPAQVSHARKQSRNAQMRLFNIVHPPQAIGISGKGVLS